MSWDLTDGRGDGDYGALGRPGGQGPTRGGVNDFLREEYARQGVDTSESYTVREADVAAYLEYDRIVGDADGGQLLSEKEYAAFRARALRERANRLYTSWRCVETGVDCKMIGPSSKCFCGHMYKRHTTDNMHPQHKMSHEKDVHCKEPGCGCTLFDYLPSHGTWAIKCMCKHEAAEHDPRTKRCSRGCGCRGFTSNFSCTCGRPWAAHRTTFQTKAERAAEGRPVDNLAGGGQMYEALGGITRFESLADGCERSDRPLPMTDLGMPPRLPDGRGPPLLRDKQAARGGGGGFYHRQLENIYQQYCPEKLGLIDELLEKYKGREQTIIDKVRAKYCTPMDEDDGRVPPWGFAGAAGGESSGGGQGRMPNDHDVEEPESELDAMYRAAKLKDKAQYRGYR